MGLKCRSIHEEQRHLVAKKGSASIRFGGELLCLLLQVLTPIYECAHLRTPGRCGLHGQTLYRYTVSP